MSDVGQVGTYAVALWYDPDNEEIAAWMKSNGGAIRAGCCIPGIEGKDFGIVGRAYHSAEEDRVENARRSGFALLIAVVALCCAVISLVVAHV